MPPYGIALITIAGYLTMIPASALMLAKLMRMCDFQDKSDAAAGVMVASLLWPGGILVCLVVWAMHVPMHHLFDKVERIMTNGEPKAVDNPPARYYR